MAGMEEPLLQVKQQPRTTSTGKTENSAQKLEKMTAPKRSGEPSGKRPHAQDAETPEVIAREDTQATIREGDR